MELKIIELVSADFLSPDGGVPSWKRALDPLVILLALPVILPVVLVIALYIKIVSRGPVLFRQERIGYYGQPFVIFKFRTMHENASIACHQDYLKDLISSSKPMTKMDSKGDRRLIKGGGFLRATALDELPQLINVLRGEMSIVGPRPSTAYEYEQYSPWHSRRLEALPGLTGLWQVSGKNKLTFEQMIQLDIHYAEQSSLWLDLRIMLRTFPVLLAQLREVLTRRWSERQKKKDSKLSREITPRVLSAEHLSHRSVRSCKEKKCQTRVMLESSDVDTGVRT